MAVVSDGEEAVARAQFKKLGWEEELFELVETDPDADTWALDEGPDLIAGGMLTDEAEQAWMELSEQMRQDLESRPFEY